MDYNDATLVRLASPATRDTLFDQPALAQLIAAAYKTELMVIQGPYQAVFDEFRLGFSVNSISRGEAVWAKTGTSERTEAHFTLTGLGGAPVRVDALWRGGVVARTAPGNSIITDAVVTIPALGTIDSEIAADLGALPADPAALETERRNRLLERVRSSFNDPSAYTDAALDMWLRRAGAVSVSDLLENQRGVEHAAAITITYAPPAAVPSPTPRLLPITAAIFIRNNGFSVSQLIIDSKLVREQFEPLGLQPTPVHDLPTRNSILLVWIVPLSVFDDEDWPGGDAGSPAQRRNDRRAFAAQWLAQEGIAVVATN